MGEFKSLLEDAEKLISYDADDREAASPALAVDFKAFNYRFLDLSSRPADFILDTFWAKKDGGEA